MTKQSLGSRLGHRALPWFSQRIFNDEWMEAGNDRILLQQAATRRRRLDGSRPDALLRRRWTMTTTDIAGRELVILTPKTGSTGRLLFYVHGGAYVVGPSAVEWLNAASLARRLDADLALYDYPKSPEYDAGDTIPASIEAWQEVTSQYEPERIVLAGTSAGGGLAAGLLATSAATGIEHPAGAILISPWLDLVSAHPDAERFAATDRLLPIDRLRRDGEVYGGRLDLTDPSLSPRYTSDDALAGLPPMVVTVGEQELFFPEAQEFVGRVNDAGGSASLLVESFGQHATALVPLRETADIRRTVVDTGRRWLQVD